MSHNRSTEGKRQRKPDSGIESRSRRAWITKVALVAAGALAKAADEVMHESSARFINWLAPQPPELPSGRPSGDPREWLRELFGEWRYYSAVAGKDNRDFLERGVVHPDILEPFNTILPLWDFPGGQLIATAESDLPQVPWSDSLVLVGGPVSNVYARRWQGYEQSPETKVFEFKGSAITRRWRFEYDLGEPRDAGPARIVEGQLHRSWPQAIVDESLKTLIRPRTSGADRILAADWLVVSFVPNPSDPQQGTTIVDASDLHGQGNKAFGKLLRDVERLNELTQLIRDRAIRPGEFFQALYRVDVVHDRGSSTMSDYALIDVAPVRT